MSSRIQAIFLCVTAVTASLVGIPTPGFRSSGIFRKISNTTALLFGGLDGEQNTLNDLHLYDEPTQRYRRLLTFGVAPSVSDYVYILEHAFIFFWCSLECTR